MFHISERKACLGKKKKKSIFDHELCTTSLKVSRSRNMKQKIDEILTSPEIQTNGLILNNCID